MATITVKINNTTRKTQHLVGLIAEIAKSDKNVKIIETEQRKETGIEEALDDVAKGKVTTIHVPKNWGGK